MKKYICMLAVFAVLLLNPLFSAVHAGEYDEAATAVDVISKITKKISDIEGIATMISAAIEEQSVSTQEISRNVQQAAEGAKEVSANVQKVSSAAQEVGDVASTVMDSSADMSMQNDLLTNTVEGFLKNIKSV